MNNEQLAEFHGVNLRSTYRWTPETKHKKTVQAQADVTPDEWRLIGEIMQLVHLYNAKGWDGNEPKNWCGVVINSCQLTVTFYLHQKKVNELYANLISAMADVHMQVIKSQLEKLVYVEVK